jgi:hypothetical protein
MGRGGSTFRAWLDKEVLPVPPAGVQAYLSLHEPHRRRESEQLLKTNEYREAQVMATM